MGAVMFDKWRTMKALEREYAEGREDGISFTQLVMDRLQCPSYEDAEIAILNYNRSKKETTCVN